MRRRDFIAGLGGAAVWLGIGSLIARAQHTANPVIGFLSIETSNDLQLLPQFHDGLREAGFVEGQNVAVEYRWAGDEYDRVPALAAELVQRRVSVIVAGPRCELQAKNATATIPIVFMATGDPSRLGLVQSLSHPGGNLTGTTLFASDLTTKRLGLLHQIAPDVKVIAHLRDATRTNAANLAFELEQVQTAARSIGVSIRIVSASSDFDEAFAVIGREGAGAVLVGASAHFFAQRERLAAAAARYRIPASYDHTELTEAGGLMSYGVNIPASFRQVGLYTGRILKGEKPRDLPVVLPTKFALVINLKAASALGLELPPTLLTAADEVIE
jgi:putative tryptophan/tyrosine transport system substrate-binding protein